MCVWAAVATLRPSWWCLRRAAPTPLPRHGHGLAPLCSAAAQEECGVSEDFKNITKYIMDAKWARVGGASWGVNSPPQPETHGHGQQQAAAPAAPQPGGGAAGGQGAGRPAGRPGPAGRAAQREDRAGARENIQNPQVFLSVLRRHDNRHGRLSHMVLG